MNHPVLSLLSLILLSSSAWAVVNGSPVDWEAKDNAVRLENSINKGSCSATLVSGRYVLTAAHCLDGTGINTIVTASGDTISFSQTVMHPDYVNEQGIYKDVGIVTLDKPVDYAAIQFLNIDNRIEDEPITIAGFGGTIETLNAVELAFSHYHWAYPFALYADVVNLDSHTVEGDSGAPWINKTNDIMAIHNGSTFNSSSNERPTYATDIQAVQDFLTENINAWHYPTLAEVNGRTTITVQSLHQSGITDTAYVQGNITLIPESSTCVTEGLIEPFEQCTYVIEGSSGEEGQLYLSDSEVIHINKPKVDNGGTSSSGSSGGSLGFLSLLGLAVFGRLRKR
ncbi:putative trypsin protease [Vibrio crassostreae]|nr:putative trypsin protease [Vibrio crassostreae]CAK1810498.1 putative trypsin protease [Vibrio crassostreae]CAK1814658.1 putative trypsin protease [Vibrio crassostreae]CAK1896540.1 putative trypsin protease [Vibrio crassostreae]CAK3168022.1 putative trypsin protease [Vibrio crassostreae]